MESQNFLYLLQTFFIFTAVIFCITGILYFSVAAMRRSGFSHADRNMYSLTQGDVALDGGMNTSARIDDLLNSHARRVNVSFYFSLILATIGLLMVMFALLGIEAQTWHGSLLKLTGALLVEIVAIAFFLNSLRAQREIGEIMRAERDERRNGEVSDLLSQMSDTNRRDQLIAQLIMKRSVPNAPRL